MIAARRDYLTRGLIALALAGLLAGCEPISEPWVKGDRLAAERTRTPEQTQELKQRLRTYGGAYQ